jgi:hypothetical protein
MKKKLTFFFLLTFWICGFSQKKHYPKKTGTNTLIKAVWEKGAKCASGIRKVS